ncbi:hypothetical protein M406DRAFT_69790 [Cryphonectria parasitica EP155]|uniref:Uncharacterized protein n=1 Tax=Cryphonectria parasitica (strain ATCC 38755 / EP155) TaxID=660469 RepID=A0A9P4Y647_CRYP1|nr:uncharacterized protein M406DRAFT_69790 [Cryphonectria parasitica EP155]KAF3767664.1 hypothetical protein M406DRAFT_69790 [Cryphonectria parasitica EP155]
MAQGLTAALQSVPAPSVALGLTSTLTEHEKQQIEGCKRIIRFQDEVLSGTHPRIKAPAYRLASIQNSEPQSPASTSTAASSGPVVSVPNAPRGPKAWTAKVNGAQVTDNHRSFNSNAQHTVASATNPTPARLPGVELPSNLSSSMSGVPAGPKARDAARPSENAATAQFDPVLLTKSEDLIKAELQIQRKHLERALNDQVQQQRVAAKASHSDDALADFDLAEVLMKALQLVQSSAPLQTDANLTANASGADSDSIGDDSTFYSSKHDTPESHLTHRIPDPDESDAAQQAREESHYEPPMVMEASPVPVQPPVVAMPVPAGPSVNTSEAQRLRHPRVFEPTLDDRTRPITLDGRSQPIDGMAMAQEAASVPMEIISSQDSEEANSSRDSGLADGKQYSSQGRLESATGQLIEQAFGRRRSPILRAHNLSPLAPQPAHVSPLAHAHRPPALPQDALSAQATPAQVAALRNDRSNGSSPESSPQGRPNKKNKKGKKRKADRTVANNAAAAVASPAIKAEPRSPSPLTAPQYSRPAKRVRQAPRPGQEQIFDEPRVEEVVESPHASSYSRYRSDRGSAYGSPLGPRARQDAQILTITESPRYEQQYREDVRPVEPVRYVRRISPGAQPHPYASGEVRTFRSVSRAGVDRPLAFQEARDPPRTIVRPVADRDRSRSPILIDERPQPVMRPPQMPASRVVVDEFGREYIDPSSRQESVIIRRSVAPRPVYEDRDDYYDPNRTTTRVIRRSVAPASVYGEPEIVYERGHPLRAASTLPGPSRYDDELVYRNPASSAGYTTTRRIITRSEYAPEYRYYRERDYPAQPSSQPSAEFYGLRATQEPRPPMGDPPREYIVRSTTVRPEASTRPEGVRMSSVRPEHVTGDYGSSIVLDERLPPPRAYSVRPMAPPPPPQQPQYVRQWPEYEARPAHSGQDARGEDDGVVYVDTVSRDAYR